MRDLRRPCEKYGRTGCDQSCHTFSRDLCFGKKLNYSLSRSPDIILVGLLCLVPETPTFHDGTRERHMGPLC